MKCEDVNNNMLALVEGTLDRETESRLREHIDSCKVCTSQLTFIGGAIGQINSDRELKVSAGFSDGIFQKVKERKRPLVIYRNILGPIAAAAVVVFGIFTGMFISDLTSDSNYKIYADLPDEYYYTNEIHLETIEGFFLTNED